MYQTRPDGQVLVLEFRSREEMNRALDELSRPEDGLTAARTGHNFPVTSVPGDHWLQEEFTPETRYIVAYCKGDVQTYRHEQAHARFALDSAYHAEVVAFWNSLTPQQQTHITDFLKRLGYSDSAVLDEFQAYAVTEKSNFFGIRLEVSFCHNPHEAAARQVGLKLTRRKR